MFCPADPVQRWVMAVWLVRVIDGGDPNGVGVSRFADVDAGEWWVPHVDRLAELGITAGCATGPLRFCPSETVTRDQMASFLVRAFGLGEGPSSGFVDIEDNVHASNIDVLAAVGVTAGCSTSPARYCPRRETTRGQMATFLSRALQLGSVRPDQPPQDGGFATVSNGNGFSCGLLVDGTVVCWGGNWDGQAAAPQGEFSAVSAGNGHSCGIRTDWTVVCWGTNWGDQADAPEGEFSAVSAGNGHSCGIRTEGTVVCWGPNWGDQVDAPEGRFSAVSAGETHSCGIRTDWTVACWGTNSDGQADAPEGKFSAVSAGNGYSCGVRSDGTVACWGTNWWGRADAPWGKFSAVSAGETHSCGVRADGTVACWGENTDGRSDPPEGQFSAVSAGEFHSCGVRSDGTVACWGENIDGRPEAPGGKFRLVSTGGGHSCGVRADETVACWGYGGGGRVDPPDGTFVGLTVGFAHSCGIRTDGTVACWGPNWWDRADAPEGQFSAVSAGYGHSCGVRTDGTVACWGGNWEGQADAPEDKFSAVSAGYGHSCGVRTDGTVVCWGSNWEGRADAPEGKFSAVAAGFGHSCGIRTDGTVVCWGSNWEGRADAPEGKFSAVAAGFGHSCGVRTDGTVVCWGRNSDSQTDAPQGEFTAVTAEGAHSCGIRTNGTVTCWGRDPVVSFPAAVQQAPWTQGPDPRMCRPKGTQGDTAGFPLPGWAVPSTGTVRVVVLFLDFPDAQATTSVAHELKAILPYMEKYLESSSYGKLDLEFVSLDRWLRAEFNYRDHVYTSPYGIPELRHEVDREAVRLADPDFDFTGIDALIVLMPSAHFSGGNALGSVQTDEGTVSTLRMNAFPSGPTYHQGRVGAHELVHNLGLLDLGPYDLRRHQPEYTPRGQTWAQARFGLMGMQVSFPVSSQGDPRVAHVWEHPDGSRSTGYTNSLEALEMLAWSRWQLGWLDTAQILCVTESEATATLSPVADPGDGIAMVAVPLSDTEVIIIENRRKLGYDTSTEYRTPEGNETLLPALPAEGVLIYTVDAAIATGELPVKVAGDPGTGHIKGFPILTDGESVTIHGYTITVVSTTPHTTITITQDAGGSDPGTSTVGDSAANL